MDSSMLRWKGLKHWEVCAWEPSDHPLLFWGLLEIRSAIETTHRSPSHQNPDATLGAGRVDTG
jgi:hypothetical protein